MAAWSTSTCLTHWHPIHVLFVFFCISSSAYFCHIVKLLIKKETTKLSLCFLPPLFAISVGLITTNYNQQHLSSLLQTKCQKDKIHRFLRMIKPCAPSQAGSEPSHEKSSIPAVHQLALVSQAKLNYTATLTG